MIRVAFVALIVLVASQARTEPLTVFAAASLKNAFDGIAQAFEAETGVEVVVSYAGTSILARQIEQGAPADIFASAHPVWMDHLVERGAVDPESVETFAANELVLIAPVADAVDVSLDFTSADDLLATLGNDGRMAVALTNAVPAGIYAREALSALGLWGAFKPRLAETDNVRTALLLVARGEAPLGIVYASDAAADARVAIVHRFDLSMHSPIMYSAARVTRTRNTSAESFLDFLLGEEAPAALEAAGFLLDTDRQSVAGAVR